MAQGTTFVESQHTSVMKQNNWNRLDNAALIYTSLLSEDYATNFRMSVSMSEEVDRDILYQSLLACMDRFPSFRYSLKKGLYWWYMKTIENDPVLHEASPLSSRPLKDADGYLFRMSSHGCTIDLDVFHSLGDGTSALTFLLTVAGEYVKRSEGCRIEYNNWVLNPGESAKEEEWADAFDSFGSCSGKLENGASAYHYKGTRLQNGKLENTRISIATEDLKARCSMYRCTMTELLTGLMIKALQDMRRYDVRARKSSNLKVCVPVNLRKIFGHNTMRNFSSYINVGVDVSSGNYSLADIIKIISTQKQQQTGIDSLISKVSANVQLENNLSIRCVPRVIKKPVMAIIGKMKGDRYNSQTLSNLGEIILPDAMKPFVTDINFQLGKQFTNAGAASCSSYNGRTNINLSRSIAENDFERWLVHEMKIIGISPKVSPAFDSDYTCSEKDCRYSSVSSRAARMFPRYMAAGAKAIAGAAFLPIGLTAALLSRSGAVFGPYFMI